MKREKSALISKCIVVQSTTPPIDQRGYSRLLLEQLVEVGAAIEAAASGDVENAVGCGGKPFLGEHDSFRIHVIGWRHAGAFFENGEKMAFCLKSGLLGNLRNRPVRVNEQRAYIFHTHIQYIIRQGDVGRFFKDLTDVAWGQ